jgi:hypothetical protein
MIRNFLSQIATIIYTWRRKRELERRDLWR